MDPNDQDWINKILSSIETFKNAPI